MYVCIIRHRFPLSQLVTVPRDRRPMQTERSPLAVWLTHPLGEKHTT